MRALVLGISLLTAPGLAIAQGAPPTPSAGPAVTRAAAPAATEAPLICKKEDVSGSRVRKRRVCKTAREWVARRPNDGRAFAEELDRDRERTINPEPAGN